MFEKKEKKRKQKRTKKKKKMLRTMRKREKRGKREGGKKGRFDIKYSMLCADFFIYSLLCLCHSPPPGR